MFLYIITTHRGGTFVAGPIRLVVPDDAVSMVSAWKQMGHGNPSSAPWAFLNRVQQDFPCLDLRVSEPLMSGSGDKTERLKLPNMWLWGGRRVGSGRDLLVIQTDVIVLG